MENFYLFGKFRDDKKEKTMSFRVSKETHKLFETHAKYTYGDVSNGLKEIFIDYMSRHAFRRQSLTSTIKIFIPKCENEEEFENHSHLPTMEFELIGIVPPSNLVDIGNVIVDSDWIKDYNTLDLSKWYIKDSYEDDSGWISKNSVYNIDEGFVVEFPLNNHLDWNRKGVYCINDENLKEDDVHSGLVIVDYEDIVYYVEFIFSIYREKSYPIKVFITHLLTNKDAFERALDCGNLELAKVIDSFNEGTSNIEHDKQMLLDKRENLINQIREIDDKLSKF